MADYSLLIDCRDFGEGDEYLLLDAILCSSCFADAGLSHYGSSGRRRAFRRYAAKFYPNVLVPESPIPRKERHRMLRFLSPDHDQIMERVLFSYGVRVSGIVDVCGTPMKELVVPDMALPTMTLLNKGNVKPSQRVVADGAYQKWLKHGGTHGNDIDNWLSAETEMFDRLEVVVKGLA